MKNIVFIDGQNLYIGTSKSIDPWKINLHRFKIYLEKKYQAEKVYYFLGFPQKKNRNLYEKIQKAGFILVFKKHNISMRTNKKGNVDSDIIFSIMKKLYKKEIFDKVILVSGDGDYKMLVDFLIEEGRFKKILFPSHKSKSSLFKSLSAQFFDTLDQIHIRNKIKK